MGHFSVTLYTGLILMLASVFCRKSKKLMRFEVEDGKVEEFCDSHAPAGWVERHNKCNRNKKRHNSISFYQVALSVSVLRVAK